MNRIKIICTSLASFILFTILFYSCSNNSTGFKVGILLDDYTQERWEKDRDYMIKEIESRGGSVIVEVAEGDDLKQIQQASKLIYKGIDVLIVVPVNLESASKIIEQAHQNRVKVIAYDRLIKNCDLDFYISFDNVKVGILQAQYLTEKCPKGNYALINGPIEDNNSYLLRIGQLSILQTYIEENKINLAYDVFVEKWKGEYGFNHMKSALEETNDSIDAVIAGNDDLAWNAIEYYKSVDSTFSKKICFAGQDAELKSCQSIVNGHQTMTVYKPIRKLAAAAAQIAEKLAKNEKISSDSITSINNNQKIVPAILITPELVTADNIKETVIKDGYLTEEQIYSK